MSGHKSQQTQPTPRSQIIIGSGFLVIGTPIALFGLYFLLLGDQSRAWPSVVGVVESSAVRLDHDIHRRLQSGGAAARSRRKHVVEIAYRYEVDGQLYRSTRYSFGSGDTVARARNKEKAHLIARQRFPVGKEIRVFYDPEEPKQSVLAGGLNWGTFVPLVLGLFFALAGASIVALAVRQRSETFVNATN